FRQQHLPAASTPPHGRHLVPQLQTAPAPHAPRPEHERIRFDSSGAVSARSSSRAFTYTAHAVSTVTRRWCPASPWLPLIMQERSFTGAVNEINASDQPF